MGGKQEELFALCCLCSGCQEIETILTRKKPHRTVYVPYHRVQVFAKCVCRMHNITFFWVVAWHLLCTCFANQVCKASKTNTKPFLITVTVIGKNKQNLVMIFRILLILLSPVFTLADAPESWQMGFQDPATPVMQGIIDLHHDIMFFMFVILVFVVWMLSRTLYHFHQSRNPIPEKIIHGTTIEIAWTVAPSLILVLIAIPSFALLYSMDEVVDPAVTIKAIGHQWYWSYEYSDYNQSDEQGINFDSYMIPEDELELGQLRLLEVDNRVVIPVNTHVRMIMTSADVLHSWAVPSLGVKTDAVPGRLNQTPIFVKREGVFYGQCSELCGANHAFMPIVVEAVSLDNYISWVSNKLEEE